MEPPNLLMRPILAPLLAERRAALILTGAAAGHVLLSALGLPSWQCPFRHYLHLPCPGCGLTRATDLLLHGHWQQSLAVHAFAPLVLLLAAALLLAAFMPNGPRLAALRALERWERHSGFAAWALLALMGYWLLRMLLFRPALFALVM